MLKTSSLIVINLDNFVVNVEKSPVILGARGNEFKFKPQRKRELLGYFPFSLRETSFFRREKFYFLTFKNQRRGGLIYSIKDKFLFINYIYGNQREKYFLLSFLLEKYPQKIKIAYIVNNISFSKKLIKKGGVLLKKSSLPF